MKNSDIYSAINLSIKNAEQQLSQFRPLHPELENVISQLEVYDFEQFKENLKLDVRKKVVDLWTNENNGVDKSETVQAFLFEHYDPEEKNTEAFTYGIIDWENVEFAPIYMEMGFNYDFAQGLEADSGIVLSYLDPIADLNSDEIKDKFGGTEFWEAEGFWEMRQLVELKGLKNCHEAFIDLNQEGVFDEINKSDNFLFLLGQHDCPASPIIIIE